MTTYKLDYPSFCALKSTGELKLFISDTEVTLTMEGFELTKDKLITLTSVLPGLPYTICNTMVKLAEDSDKDYQVLADYSYFLKVGMDLIEPEPEGSEE